MLVVVVVVVPRRRSPVGRSPSSGVRRVGRVGRYRTTDFPFPVPSLLLPAGESRVGVLLVYE